MGSNAKMQKTSQVKQDVPAWVEDGGKFLVSEAKGLADTPFTPYTGNRVAELTGDQTSAFAKLRDLVNNAPNVGPQANATVAQGAMAPAQTVGPAERVVDEGGRLGAITDYPDPYMTAAAGPMQAAIRRIQEQADARPTRTLAIETLEQRHDNLERQPLGDDAETRWLLREWQKLAGDCLVLLSGGAPHGR